MQRSISNMERRRLLLYYEYLKCKPAKPNQKSLIMIKKKNFYSSTGTLQLAKSGVNIRIDKKKAQLFLSEELNEEFVNEY